VRFGRTLLDAASEPKKGWFAPEAGHEDLARYGSLDVVVAFIDRRLGGRDAGSPSLLLPNECDGTSAVTCIAPRPDHVLTVDLAVNPWGTAAPHNHNALRVHIPLPTAPRHNTVSDNQSNRNAVRQTR